MKRTDGLWHFACGDLSIWFQLKLEPSDIISPRSQKLYVLPQCFYFCCKPFSHENGNDDDPKYFGKLRVWLVGLDIKLRKLIQSSPIYHFSVCASRTIHGGRWWYNKGGGALCPCWATITLLFCRAFSCRGGAHRLYSHCNWFRTGWSTAWHTFWKWHSFWRKVFQSYWLYPALPHFEHYIWYIILNVWKCLNVHSVCTNSCLIVHGVCTNLCLNVHSPCLFIGLLNMGKVCTNSFFMRKCT